MGGDLDTRFLNRAAGLYRRVKSSRSVNGVRDGQADRNLTSRIGGFDKLNQPERPT